MAADNDGCSGVRSSQPPCESQVSFDGLGGFVADDTIATLRGPWQKSTIAAGVHRGYLHDGALGDGSCVGVFPAYLEPGSYAIQIAYTSHANRATNIPIEVRIGREVMRFRLIQCQAPSGGAAFHTIGILQLGGETQVVLGNEGADGHVIIDAVRFVEQSPR